MNINKDPDSTPINKLLMNCIEGLIEETEKAQIRYIKLEERIASLEIEVTILMEH